MTGSVAGVDYHRQVAVLLNHRDGSDIQREAYTVFEGPDTSLAEDNAFIPAGQEVVCRCQPLGNRAGKTTLEYHRPLTLANRCKQGEVLHISRAYLENIGYRRYRGDIPDIDYLGHYRHSELFFCFLQ